MLASLVSLPTIVRPWVLSSRLFASPALRRSRRVRDAQLGPSSRSE